MQRNICVLASLELQIDGQVTKPIIPAAHLQKRHFYFGKGGGGGGGGGRGRL